MLKIRYKFFGNGEKGSGFYTFFCPGCGSLTRFRTNTPVFCSTCHTDFVNYVDMEELQEERIDYYLKGS